jgi:hypothetical protein
MKFISIGNICVLFFILFINNTVLSQSTNIDSIFNIVDCKELQLPLLVKKYGKPKKTYEVTYTDGRYGYGGEKRKPKKIKRKKYIFNNCFSILLMSNKDAGKGYKKPFKTLEVEIFSLQNPWTNIIERYRPEDIVLLLEKSKIKYERADKYIKIRAYNITIYTNDNRITSVKKCYFYCEN